MGDRANIVFHDGCDASPAIYLHWGGNPESVYALLDEFKGQKPRMMDDAGYASARFCAFVCSKMDSSVGLLNGPEEITVGALRALDHGDNGVYVVGEDFSVRRFFVTNAVGEMPPDEVAEEARNAREHTEADDFYLAYPDRKEL